MFNSCLKILVVLLFLSCSTIYSQSVVKKVISSETGESIPFATISTIDGRVGVVADETGCFKIEPSVNEKYIISHVGYKDTIVLGIDIKNNSDFFIKEHPIEINPIIVSADAARLDIFKAIDSTYKAIPTNYSLNCFQLDNVCIDTTIIAEAKSFVSVNIVKKNKPAFGCKLNSNLNQLSVNYKQPYTVDSIKYFPFGPFNNINAFLLSNKKDNKNLIFTYHEFMDSIIVISYRPKSSYQPKHNYYLTSGKFFINKNSWKFTRIESELGVKMIEKQNEIAESAKKQKLKIKKYSMIIIFSKNGIPTEIQRVLVYSKKSNSKEQNWKCSSTQFYRNCNNFTEKKYPERKLKNKQLLFQKPSCSPDFDDVFNNILPSSASLSL